MMSLAVPINYSIDPERRLVLTSVTGVITRQDVLDFCRQLRTNPRFDKTFNEISEIDAGAISKLRYEDLDHIRAFDPFSPASRRAFVAVADVDYGNARIYESLIGGDAQVFRSIQEAMGFLVRPRD